MEFCKFDWLKAARMRLGVEEYILEIIPGQGWDLYFIKQERREERDTSEAAKQISTSPTFTNGVMDMLWDLLFSPRMRLTPGGERWALFSSECLTECQISVY